MLLLFSQGEIGITGNRPALKAIRGGNGDFLLTDNTGGGHTIHGTAVHGHPTDGGVLLTKFCIAAEYATDDFIIVGEVTGTGDIFYGIIIDNATSNGAVF